MDGTYTPSTTGLPSIDCSTTGNARSGTEGDRIVVRAQNERRAHLRSDGTREAFFMTNCRYWTVSGLHGSNADNTEARSTGGHVFRFAKDGSLRLERLLAVRPNRRCPNSTLAYCNAHALEIDDSRDVLVEDVEAYDFHRHGISIFGSQRVNVRRAYVSSRNDDTDISTSGIILYGSADSIVENSITDGLGGISVAGSHTFDGSPGGYRNLLVGNVAMNGRYGTTIRARRFGGPVLPASDNTVRHSVYVNPSSMAIFARGAADTLVENVTMYGSRSESGLVADEDSGEAPCGESSEGCSITVRNVLSFGHRGDGIRIRPDIVNPWRVEHSNSVRNGGANYAPAEPSDDGTGNIRHSRSVSPGGMGLGEGQCILWPPDDSNMKGAGRDGADIGARVLYRYERGELTRTPLWDPATGAFPCGAVVAGVNDVAGSSCRDVHERLNAGRNGCAFPAGYP
jgi:hypothetical protein